MTPTLSSLRLLLADGYDEFARRLGRRLGSADLAEEALQDTYIRLSRIDSDEPVRNPRAYIFRMAFNAAISRLRNEKRRLTVAEGAAFLDLLQQGADFEERTEIRSDLEMAQRALRAMSPRRQAIVKAAWVDEEPTRLIAERLDLSVRTIQNELKAAADGIAERLQQERAGDGHVHDPDEA